MKYTKEVLEEAVKVSFSIADVLRFLKIKLSGSMHRHIAQRIKNWEIETSHFKQEFLGGVTQKLECEKILVFNRLNRRESSKRLRRAMLECGIEENCSKCGLGKFWNGESIRLQIDHKNGDGCDNRKENLRFLCPNCHSQTANYAGKGNKTNPAGVMDDAHFSTKEKDEVRFLGGVLRRKVDWPTKEELAKLLWEKPTQHIAKDYGVSDKAVEKWAKKYELEKPKRGYWSKQSSR